MTEVEKMMGLAEQLDGGFTYEEGERRRQALRDAITKLVGERDAAVKELKESDDASDAMDLKLKSLAPHGTCGCSYDHPNDVCLHHSPKLSQAIADNVRLAAELERHKQAVKAKWALVDNLDGAGLRCLWCEGKLDYIKVPNGLMFPEESDFVHDPECIVMRGQ